MLSRTVLLGAILAASMAASSAQVVTSNSFGSSRSSSSTDFLNGKSYAQWTMGDLTCYVAQENGRTVKYCRNGLLDPYHPMTPKEEAIINEEILKGEQQTAEFNARMADAGATMQNSMNQMQSQIQRSMSGMNNMMRSMQNAIQGQMAAAFG